MPIKYAETGRRTWGVDKFHLESVHPEVILRTSSESIDTIISGGNLNTAFGDSASIDAFARLRVSNPVGLFDSQLQYDLNRVLWEDDVTDTSGNAEVAHLPNYSGASLTVEAQDTIIRQSRQYIRYQPGKSQQVLITFVMGAAAANVTQRVGYFDDDNGIFVELDGTTLNLVLRSKITGAVVDNEIAQTSWNLDKLDGTGASGYTLNIANGQIFFVDLEWLAVGRVRVGFVIDGIPYYAHEFLHANRIATPYMTTANLPIRYEISAAAGVAGSHTLTAICSAVASEGGIEVTRGLPFSVTNGTTTRSVTNATPLPLISIRPKTTFNSIENRATILAESFSVFSEDQPVMFEIIFGGTLTNASFGSANADSVTEFDVAATAISGGISILSDFVPASNSAKTGGVNLRDIAAQLPMFLDIAGSHPTTPYTDSLSIVATSMVAQASDCSASIAWRELR